MNADVLSRYPLLSQRLRNAYLSKQIHEDTLRGVCDLEISQHDIKNVIIPYLKNSYSQRIIFSRSSDKDLDEGFNWFLAQIINKKIFGDDDIYVETYIQARIDDKNWVNPGSSVFSIKNRYTEETNGVLGIEPKILNLYFDLLTIKDFYLQRYQCARIDNYVRRKVLEYFDNVVMLLNEEDIQHMLYLYLVSNCVVLNIPLPYKIPDFESSLDDYPGYATSIKPINEELYTKIKNAINNF